MTGENILDAPPTRIEEAFASIRGDVLEALAASDTDGVDFILSTAAFHYGVDEGDLSDYVWEHLSIVST